MSSATLPAALSEKFEDLYPLTPFQQGMLFHVLDTPGAGVYMNQQRYTLRGDVDLSDKFGVFGAIERNEDEDTTFSVGGLMRF